jgi:hypothetical protein
MSKRYWKPKQENPIDPPPGGIENYVSYQKIINSNNGQIDEKLLEEHIQDITENKGFEEIEVDFSLLKKGDRIRYTTVQNGKYLFRTGGWVISIDDNHEYLAYMSHTQTSWSVQASDCKRLFVKRRRTKETKDHRTKGVIYFKKPTKETKYPVYFSTENKYTKDSDAEKIVVYYARDNNIKAKFESTLKYKKVVEENEMWDFVPDQ